MDAYNLYLSQIQLLGTNSALEKLYLWPAVNMWQLTSDEIQKYIIHRVGVSDAQANHPHSRPFRIIDEIKRLIEKNILSDDFSLLDITYGDGLNLLAIKQAFQQADLFGIDCCTDAIDTHPRLRQEGIHLYKGYIQHLFTHPVKHPFDVIIMLNTYRGWESAKLREHEIHLPKLADSWFEANAKLLFLTVTDQQLHDFKKRGYVYTHLGKGEDASHLVCLSKEPIYPKANNTLWRKLLGIVARR